MRRSEEAEILDDPGLPDDLVERAFRDIATIHRWLGDTRLITRAIRRDCMPVARILDVGCGTGLVLQRVGRALDVDVVGADVRPRSRVSAPVQIIRADACLDRLPTADVAFCMYLCHHLTPDEVIRLIRNVGRYCRRFIMLDLVRHPLPLALFRWFVAPMICDVDAEDGRRSIRRAYTPRELRDITASALAGSDAQHSCSVSPFWIRQVVDISYSPRTESNPEAELLAEEGQCLR